MKNRLTVLLMAAAVVLGGLSACGGPTDPDPPGPVTFSGTIMSGGAPLAGVQVFLSRDVSRNTVTDANGAFSFTNVTAVKEADRDRKLILARLEEVTDERAARVKEALGKKEWGLAEVEAVLAGSPTTGDKDGATDLLKRLAVLQPPDPKAVADAVQALRDADQRQTAAAQTVAGKSDQLATLLDHALSFHKAHGDGDCPVCGKPNALDPAWHQQKAQEAEALRQAAREATEARKAVVEAQATVQRLTAVDWDTAARRLARVACVLLVLGTLVIGAFITMR